MSEENNETKTVEATAPARPAKASVSADDVQPLVAGISSYDKAAFRVYGQKGSARLTLPKTQKIARGYFYGEPVPDHRAIVKFTEEQRKDKKLGGITAEIDFSQGQDAALEAIKLLADVVRKAPAVQPKQPKEEPAVEQTETV